MNKIRVLCVDDSVLMRGVMRRIINAQADMEVVAVAPDPLVARELIKRHNPDVLTLDVEMPRMGGLDFLERLMRLRPMPVIMVSSLTADNSAVTLRALELGAVDFVEKPGAHGSEGLGACAEAIVEKIRVAAMARMCTAASRTRAQIQAPDTPPRVRPGAADSGSVIAIGASTGGPEAIRVILQALPQNCPAVLITQHMPAGFTRSFVQRLDSLCAMSVHEAQDGQPVLPGHAYLAPGGAAHMVLERYASGYQVRLQASDPVNRHRPSVDVLFHSVARFAGSKAVGVILTGMGKDGAQGLLAMRQAGAMTFAQDEQSSVVFGMPREALLAGAAAQAVTLADMAGRILSSI